MQLTTKYGNLNMHICNENMVSLTKHDGTFIVRGVPYSVSLCAKRSVQGFQVDRTYHNVNIRRSDRFKNDVPSQSAYNAILNEIDAKLAVYNFGNSTKEAGIKAREDELARKKTDLAELLLKVKKLQEDIDRKEIELEEFKL